MRDAVPKNRAIGTRMRVPGYPSNREADERTFGSHCSKGCGKVCK